MQEIDPFRDRYDELIDGSYDGVDRIVLNGYFRFIQSSGGFRSWWRQLFGRDENLDNAHLIRFAGRFARRVRLAAEQKGIPVLEKHLDDRMHELAEQLRPADPQHKGVFCITVHRAPNALSVDARGFRVEQVADLVRETLGQGYTSRQASYDLKKLRGKGLVEKLSGTRRYLSPANGLRIMISVVVLREQVIKPILSGAVTRRRGRPPKNRDPLDLHYQALRDAMERLFHELGLAA